MKRVFWCWLINVTGSCCWQLSGSSVRSVSWTTYTWSLQERGLRVVRLLHWWLTSGKTMFQENQEEAVAPFMTQPQKLHTITSSGFYGAKQSQIHIMSIVTSVHLRIVRCHQIKKRRHIWLVLVKVYAELKKVLPLKQKNPPCETFNWWWGEHSTDPAIRPIMECSIRMSLGQEGIVLNVKWQTQDFWSQQMQAHIDYQVYLKSKRWMHRG